MKMERQEQFSLPDLVWVIGYQLTAYIGSTKVGTVTEWLRSGTPAALEERMKATLDVAVPVAEVTSELMTQGFLIEAQNDLEPYRFPAAMLRECVDVQTVRTVLMNRARTKFLNCEATDLEGIECRLKDWVVRVAMPPQTKYKVHLWDNRLSLELLHAGFSIEQQLRWDKGEDWPLWKELITEIPEIAAARACPDIRLGCPFRYLRRTGIKPGLRYLNSPKKKEWLREIKARTPESELVKSPAFPDELPLPLSIRDKCV
jgi:hypothetical protein